MANFTITSNYNLRQAYGNYKNLVVDAERRKVNTKDLVKADSSALKKSISNLSSYNYESEDSDSTELYKELKVLADTYNNTLESGNGIKDDSRTKGIIKDMKQLQKKYGDELESFGITFNDKGFMSISTSSTKNISPENFKRMVGEESDFMKDLSALAKKLSRRVDYLV